MRCTSILAASDPPVASLATSSMTVKMGSMTNLLFGSSMRPLEPTAASGP